MNPAPPNPPAPALRMEAVSVAALDNPKRVVIEDIHWQVFPGDFWVVAGLVGSGKTDFLLMTGGVMGPADGDYHFLGEPMPIFEGTRLKHRLRLGLVFENGQLLNHLTVRENVALPLCYHRNLPQQEAQPEAEAMLEALGLADWADSTPGAIGLPWLKRAGLARALMLRPEVLLVANPLGGLDLRHRSWWLGFLSRLVAGHPLYQNRPVTVVATTSDLRPWKGCACQYAVLKDRRFFVLGSEASLQAAEGPLLADLIAESEAG